MKTTKIILMFLVMALTICECYANGEIYSMNNADIKITDSEDVTLPKILDNLEVDYKRTAEYFIDLLDDEMLVNEIINQAVNNPSVQAKILKVASENTKSKFQQHIAPFVIAVFFLIALIILNLWFIHVINERRKWFLQLHHTHTNSIDINRNLYNALEIHADMSRKVMNKLNDLIEQVDMSKGSFEKKLSYELLHTAKNEGLEVIIKKRNEDDGCRYIFEGFSGYNNQAIFREMKPKNQKTLQFAVSAYELTDNYELA